VTDLVFDVGRPRVLFTGRYSTFVDGARHYDVTNDGQRFLMLKPQQHDDEVLVTRHWLPALLEPLPPN